MKFRPTQFGVRENTASPRQHAPRFASDTRSNITPIVEERPETQPTSSQNAPSVKVPKTLACRVAQRGHRQGFGDECHLLNVHEVAELLHVPVSWVYGRMRKRS